MREDVYFQNSNGDKLNGWFFQSPKKNAPVVLFNHGNAANLAYRVFLIKALMDAGASVFIYDYRQYGKSSGKKSLSGLLDDAESAYKYLTATRRLSDQKIVLYGESIGGGPTCYLLQQHKVGGIILDSTFTSLLQLAKKKVAYFNVYPDFCVPEPAFNNKATLAGTHPPLLIIHGAKDILIPQSEAQENFRAATEPKTLLLLANSDHNDKRPDFASYVEGLKNFLASL